MNIQYLLDVFVETSSLLSQKVDRCNNLIYTQKDKNKPVIREPEARYALTTILTNKKIDFGIEVPTKEKYKFTGKSNRKIAARMDLSIIVNKVQINIELKEGQNETVQKDLEKLMRECSLGCAFFHILQNSDKGTVPALLYKYKRGYYNTHNLTGVNSKWFLLFIYIKDKKECFWQIFHNILEITQDKFSLDRFTQKRIL